jgi:hypothetical protein
MLLDIERNCVRNALARARQQQEIIVAHLCVHTGQVDVSV